MKKQFKEILKNSKLKIKWKNINYWQCEKIDNLYEATQKIGIKITGTNTKIMIKFKGNIQIKQNTSLAYLEKDCLRILKLFYVYLEDETKIKSRFGNYKLN